jgi:3-phenylpropionate/trans-cinnamate dioxygenase ferredoxin subunit
MNYTQLDPAECEFFEIALLDDLPNGERIFVEIGENYLVVFNIGGQFFAIEDVCTHDDGPLGDGELEGYQVACPRHGARFDVRTGKALTFPAVEDISAYPIRIVGGKIEIGLPKS